MRAVGDRRRARWGRPAGGESGAEDRCRSDGRGRCGEDEGGASPPRPWARAAGIGAILGAPPDGAFGILVILPSEKGLQARDSIEISAFLGALKRRGRVGDVPAGPEDDPEPAGRLSMAARVRELICPLRARQITLLLEQSAEVEGAVGVTALVRALVAGRRRSKRPAGLEKHAKIERRAGMTQGIGFAVGELGAVQVASLFE